MESYQEVEVAILWVSRLYLIGKEIALNAKSDNGLLF